MNRAMYFRMAAAAVVWLAVGGPGTGAAVAQSSHDMTLEDFEQLVQDVSNWGRWGEDDQLGTLNLITPRKRREAAGLVRAGTSVSLARRVETREAPDNPSPFGHVMLANGRDYDGQWAMDQLTVSYHGLAHTHMDSLCHLFYKGTMYNGFSRDEVGPEGAERLSIDNVRNGILTRGILIDVPRLRGERFLDPGSPIYPEELEACLDGAGLEVRSGDVVFIRTGRWARRDLLGPWDANTEGLAGLHASCGKWLHEKDIAMLGSDAASDVIPSRIEGITHPIHVLTLHAMGVHIFDNCDLEAVAETAASLGRWEFMITASPLVIEGGTGSPLNPIATF
jgi:kynurenine formamidase